VVLSPECTNEDLLVLARFARDCLKTEAVYLGGRPDGEADEILRDADKNPNTTGVHLVLSAFGIEPRGFSDLLDDLQDGNLAGLYVVGSELPATGGVLGEAVMHAAETSRLVVQTDRESLAAEKAHVLLPAASWAEVDGTWTNHDGRIQRLRPAVPAKGEARPHREVTALLAQRMGHDLEVDGPRRLFSDLAEGVGAFEGLAWTDVGPHGVSTRGHEEEEATP